MAIWQWTTGEETPASLRDDVAGRQCSPATTLPRFVAGASYSRRAGRSSSQQLVRRRSVDDRVSKGPDHYFGSMSDHQHRDGCNHDNNQAHGRNVRRTDYRQPVEGLVTVGLKQVLGLPRTMRTIAGATCKTAIAR